MKNSFVIKVTSSIKTLFETLSMFFRSINRDFSTISWLEHHCRNSGVENIILWLGANNALGTVLDLKIKFTDGFGAILGKTREERLKYNLWHPNDFKMEYETLLEKTIAALSHNKHSEWHCFVGTIPLVTIAPLAKGIGEELIETSNAIIIGLDMGGNIQLFNTGASRALGYTFEEVKGTSWFDYLLDRDMDQGKLEVFQ